MSALALNLAPHGLPGRLVVLSGTDGTGKSTLARAAIRHARALGHDAVEVSVLAEYVKQSPEFRDYSRDPRASLERVDLLALSLVCAGSRLQGVREQVLPRLADGQWVFCDRYIFTTWAEFHALSDSVPERETLRAALAVFPAPDLGVLAHARPETCVGRVRTREDEQFKTLEVERYAALIASYRAVGAANGFREVCTDRPQAECEAFVAAQLAVLGATDRAPAAMRA